MNCRHCGTVLRLGMLDLGFAPPSNAYLAADDLSRAERYFPLRLRVCDECWLVQTEDYAAADELFAPDYAYFSSVSKGWLEHASRYCAEMSSRFNLGPKSFVIEIASNDGYLLKNFVAAGIPCLGIEPTDSTADAAEAIGVPTLREFFGAALGQRLHDEARGADLIAGNNVFAHVPDINDFTAGLKAALKPGGTITLEFPHLLRLVAETQFDTVYHEHFSYLSLYSVMRIFNSKSLRIFDVEELPTHGGSLRVFGCHADDPRPDSPAVEALLRREADCGLRSTEVYAGFQAKADRIKDDLLQFLIEQKRAGKRVAGYGAAAKGNTLLNYAGIKPDLLAFVCDAAPSKQGKFMPGSHIPILAPAALAAEKPDIVLVLPWNLLDEVREQNAYISAWGGRFAAAIPNLRTLEA